ncbi:pyridoxamine 5'-phosphate oxidase family protein [Nocardioides pacificus]
MSGFRPGWDAFPAALLDFWTERHLCTLTTLRTDGTPHVVPVGVALDHEQQCAWVITSGASHKARHVRAAPEGRALVAACQVDGRRWSTLEGTAELREDAESVRRAEEVYAGRYKVPRVNPQRVALRVDVARFLASAALLG